MLNKQKGNMYGFVSHTWNPIKGKCPFDCSYCYMKRFPQSAIRFDKKCMKNNLGQGNFIFLGSSVDMFTDSTSKDDIRSIINKCVGFNNRYLFQSKNPVKFHGFAFPDNTILATTIETNRQDIISKYSRAPDINSRIFGMQGLGDKEKMLTIEPVMKFDLDAMVEIVKHVEPMQVNIGADSGRNNLPEPGCNEISDLVLALSEFTNVYLKPNLSRLYQDSSAVEE